MSKIMIRIAAIILTLSFFASLLVACDKTDENVTEPKDEATEAPTEEPTEEPTETPTKPVETMDESRFNFLFKKELTCAFVLPDNSTDEENAVAEELAALIFGKLKKEPVFVKESELTDALPYAIFIGNTSSQTAKDAIAALGERESAVVSDGNKLFLVFESLSGGKGAAEALVEEIDTDKAIKNAWLPLDFSLKYKALPEIDLLPAYEEDATVIDSGLNTELLIANWVSANAFEDYCASIEAAGFRKDFDREEGDNRFAAFLAENHYVYVYRTGYNEQMRRVIAPIEQYARPDYTEPERDEYDMPYIASIPQPSSGEGYILRLPDGRFIIFDGGYKDDDRVYKTLRELESKEIVIAAWFISHPHGDHYPAFIDFIKKHSYDKTITIQSVMHNFTHYDRYYIDGSAGKDTSGDSIKEIYAAMETYVPDVPLIKVHTGQVMTFGSATVEVIYTIEDLMPKTIPNINDSSLVIRVTMADRSIMLLADTCYDSGPIMHKMWGDHLKSDMVQVAHHGMWPSVAEIYEDIKAEIVLFPDLKKNVKSWIKDSRWKAVMDVILSYARDIYISGDALEIIEFQPFPENNKDSVLQMLENL